MKSAEDWWIEGRSSTRSEVEVKNLLKQIQEDAQKELKNKIIEQKAFIDELESVIQELRTKLDKARIDSLREAAEISSGKQNFEVDHPCKGAWNGCAQEIRNAILSRIKELEEKK